MTVNEERFFKSVAKGLRATEAQTNEALSLIDYSEDFMQECIRVFLAVGCTLEEPTHRTCKKCNETKPRQQFARYGERYNIWCKTCTRKNKDTRKPTTSLHNCEGPECTRKATIKTDIGYACNAHYSQFRKKGEFTVLGSNRKTNQVSETHRRCSTCKRVKPNEEFYKSKDIYSASCKECARAYTRANKPKKKEPVATQTGTVTAYAEGEPLIAEWLAK